VTMAEWYAAFFESAAWEPPIVLTKLDWDDREDSIDKFEFYFNGHRYTGTACSCGHTADGLHVIMVSDSTGLRVLEIDACPELIGNLAIIYNSLQPDNVVYIDNEDYDYATLQTVEGKPKRQ
jgi:hypothetical protein